MWRSEALNSVLTFGPSCGSNLADRQQAVEFFSGHEKQSIRLFPWSTQERAEQVPSDMSQCWGRMGKNFHSGKPLPRAAYVHPPPIHPLQQQQSSGDLPINHHTLAGSHGGGLRTKFQSVVGPQTDVQETWRRGPEEHVCVCVGGCGCCADTCLPPLSGSLPPLTVNTVSSGCSQVKVPFQVTALQSLYMRIHR